MVRLKADPTFEGSGSGKTARIPHSPLEVRRLFLVLSLRKRFVNPRLRCTRMSESFGARLRQRREQQQIALTTIAEQTKIKVSLLEGLERDDIAHWPVGIFRRAFIRSYAHAIGLEPNVVLQEFLALHPDIDALPVEPLDALADSVRTRTKPPTRLRFLVGSAISSLSLGREAAVEKRGETIEVMRVAIETKRIDAVEATPTEPVETTRGEETAEHVDTDTAEDQPAAVSLPATEPTPFEPDLLATARLCTELGRADTTGVVELLLPEAARILDAAGLIVWIWDPQATGLRPAMAHGYPCKMVAQLPPVARDADNATAAAFRASQTCVVHGSEGARGAIVVPMMTPDGCAGVLAVELQNGREQTQSVHALASLIAAQLARSIPAERPAEAANRRLA
jgi:cytoskeletal protein RodZ